MVYKILIVCGHFQNQDKSSEFAEMGDRLTTIDMGRKVGG